MSENEEPDWLAELAKGGEALQREAMRIIKTAEQFAASGPARPFTQRIARAVGAGIRELAAPEPVVHMVSGTAIMTGVGKITAVGNITLPKMQVYAEGTVGQPDLIERNVGRIFALVVLWLVVLAVPAAVAATDLSRRSRQRWMPTTQSSPRWPWRSRSVSSTSAASGRG